MRQLWMAALAALAVVGTLALSTVPADAAEESTPPGLEVMIKPKPNLTDPKYPGWTLLDVVAPDFWQVHVVVSAHGATVLDEEPQGSSVLVAEGEQIAPGPTETAEALVFWSSCATPNTVFTYTVTAESYGEVETTTGTFPGATERQCDQARRTYAHDRVEEIRRAQAKTRREHHEEIIRLRRFEENCRTVGGIPVTIQTKRGPYRVCRSKTGGIVRA